MNWFDEKRNFLNVSKKALRAMHSRDEDTALEAYFEINKQLKKLKTYSGDELDLIQELIKDIRSFLIRYFGEII